MEDTLQWPWYAALTIFSLINLLLAIIAFMTVAEEHLPREEMGICEYATSMSSIIRIYFSRQASNLLYWFNFIFLEN